VLVEAPALLLNSCCAPSPGQGHHHLGEAILTLPTFGKASLA